jgi:hypothetical protein
MEYQKLVKDADRGLPTAERHCSVCFAPIRDVSTAARSQEGHHYCAKCGAAMFKADTLSRFRCAGHDSACARPPSA